jgi:DNA invertase Pin-like site-specific DNA recombinase
MTKSTFATVKETPHQIKRCAIYLRVSKALKRKGKTERDYTSIDAQRDTCLNFIRTQPGWVFASEYIDDGRSGKNLKRASVQRLFADINARKIDAVVVYKIDRLSRSIRDFSDIMRQFENYGVAFASVTQTFSTDTAMGKLIVNILMSFAEFEREMTAERTSDKIEATRREGKWSGGPSPLGYDYAEGTLTINDTEAPTVREAFALYLKLRSSFDVAARLNADGRATKERGPADARRRANGWTKEMVTRVLRNPIYIGMIPYAGEAFDGEHAPIIERETFEAARAILDANTIDGKRHGRNANYVLQGVLRCACEARTGEPCGHAMAPGSGGKGSGRYRYYRCVGKEKGRNDCPSRPLPAEAIESFVLDRLRDIASAGAVAAELIAYAHQLTAFDRPALAARAAEYPARIADLSARGADVADRMIRANAGARSIMENQLEALGAELETQQRELGEIQARIATIDAVSSEAGWIVEQLAAIDRTWENLTPDTRGHLIRSMVRSVDVNETANEIAITFAALDTGRRALGSDSDAIVSVARGELYRVRGRAVAFTPDAPPPALAPVRRPARLASMLALAHHMQRAIDAGTYRDQAELARALGFTRARITQVSNLTCIAPDIQAEILALEAVDGREPLHERALRPVMAPLAWTRQREAWTRVKATIGASPVNRQRAASDQNRPDGDTPRASARRAPPAVKSPSGKVARASAGKPGPARAVALNGKRGKAGARGSASANARGAKRARG